MRTLLFPKKNDFGRTKNYYCTFIIHYIFKFYWDDTKNNLCHLVTKFLYIIILLEHLSCKQYKGSHPKCLRFWQKSYEIILQHIGLLMQATRSSRNIWPTIFKQLLWSSVVFAVWECWTCVRSFVGLFFRIISHVFAIQLERCNYPLAITRRDIKL